MLNLTLTNLWVLPLYDSFIRGEEEEEDEVEEEGRDMVLEEAWAAASPRMNRELQVTIMAAVIIIMVIIVARLKQTLLFQNQF